MKVDLLFKRGTLQARALRFLSLPRRRRGALPIIRRQPQRLQLLFQTAHLLPQVLLRAEPRRLAPPCCSRCAACRRYALGCGAEARNLALERVDARGAV